jgi:DHA2 family multidrug resistance protein
MIAKVESSTHWKPKSNSWLIAATVALAAFMEVLDTSISYFGVAAKNRAVE